MILIFTSFVAGMLSILAPCVVIFVPVILARASANKRRPWVVIGSLALSVFLFSILLKSTTLLIDVPLSFWSVLSGVIVSLFGVITLWPKLWEKLSLKFNLMVGAQQKLAKASSKQGVLGDVLIGASLGPIFSACSPTYALIVATILPAEPVTGLVYLLSYIAGLTLLLVLIVLYGQKLFERLKWGLNPGSRFYKVLGILLIIIGLAIITGLDKTLLSLLVENGLFDWQINLEAGLQ